MTTHSRPSESVLRRLVDEGKTPGAIGALYGVPRSTANYWVRMHTSYAPPRRHLNHGRFLPWPLNRDHTNDGIARALRTWSTEAQGEPFDRRQGYQLKNLRDVLTEAEPAAPAGWVVSYDYDEGFFLVPRDPEIDDPDLPIRRPPGYGY